MRKLLNVASAAVLGLSLFWACHMNEAVSNRFDVVADPSWTSCDTVTAVLLDEDGSPLDTLYNAPLHSADDLKGLPADKYDGTKASIHVFGVKAGAVCFDETRSFEGDGGNVVIDTVKSLDAKPASVTVAPESLVIPLGAPGVAVKASVKPAYVDQEVDWRLAGDGIVSLAMPAGGDGTEPKINPEKIGSTVVTVKSRKDSSKTFKLKVRVAAPAGIGVTVDKDSVIAFIGGEPVVLKAEVKPDAADQKVDWSSLNPDVATIDSLGRVRGAKEGETYVQARSRANGVYFSTHVQVKRDAPRLAIVSKTGAPVNTPITFAAQATQEYGTLVLYAWDLDGDGAWDDSIVDAWPGTKVDLPVRTAKYSKEGPVAARFRVRDSEGNETLAQVNLDIGNQAPEFLSAPHDTLISIKDTVPFPVTVRDVDGKVAWIGWDYDGDGHFDDTTSPGADSVKAFFSHRYQDAGLFHALIKAKDETGKARFDTVTVRVDLDRPKAEAGNDTTVTVNAKVNVHAGGTDKLGRIVTREVRLGGAFRILAGADTAITAPAEPGIFTVYVRVTDDDGLTDVDSAVVNVVLSANADLTDLAFSAGALDPAFKPGTSNYTAHVDYKDSIVTVTPVAKDAGAKITVNAKPVASGAASDPAKLAVGFSQNVFQILVTAADGTQHLYAVSVARDPSADASLSKLDVTGFTLKPAFSPAILEYADTLPFNAGPVTFKPTLAVPTGSIAFNDSAMASGTATGPKSLHPGENDFSITVTSQSGLIKTSYMVKVYRRSQLLIFRSLDGKPGVQIDSIEPMDGISTPLSANPVTGFRFVKWTLLQGAAVLKDEAANPTEIILRSIQAKVQAEFTVNSYVIKASGTAGGAITPSGDVKVNHGTDTAFTVTALPGFRLKALTVDGADGLGGLSNGVYAFKNVTADHAINAVFAKVDTLTATSGAGGSVTPAKILVDDGADTAFTVVGNPSYRLASLLDNGTEKKANVAGNGRYPIHADGNHVLSATWIQGITMKGVAGAGGGITPDSAVVDAGSDLTYNITVNAGYRLLSLLDNGVDSTQYVIGGNQYKIAKIAGSHTVTVNFRRQYTITVNAKGPGTVTGTAGIVDSNDSRSYSLVYAKDVRVKSLLVDGVASNLSSIPFNNITANHSIDVEYIRTYEFATTWMSGYGTSGAGGSISPINPILDSNASQSFAITPALNYRTAGLKVDGADISTGTNPVSFATIAAKHSVSAVFMRTFALTGVVEKGQGTVTPTATVDSMASQTFTITAAPGYRTHTLRDNGTLVLTGSSITQYSLSGIIADHEIKAFFWRRYSVSETHTGKGKVAIKFTAPDSASTDSVTVAPDNGYRITSVTDNGSPVAITDAYKGFKFPIPNVLSDHDIAIAFTAVYHMAGYVNDAAMGSISPVSLDVDSGTAVQFTITPNSGYRIADVVDTLEGVPTDLGAVSAVNLDKVAGRHSVAVTFEAIPGYKFGVADSLQALLSRGETAGKPKLCATAGKGAQLCDDPILATLPEGTVVSLDASDYVCIANSASACIRKIPFTDWLINTGKGYIPMTPADPANPNIGQKVTIKGTTAIKARYSDEF